jgi:hypothetical protein
MSSLSHFLVDYAMPDERVHNLQKGLKRKWKRFVNHQTCEKSAAQCKKA